MRKALLLNNGFLLSIGNSTLCWDTQVICLENSLSHLIIGCLLKY